MRCWVGEPASTLAYSPRPSCRLSFLALFPGVFCGVECFRPALWSLPRGDAAITRRKRVASVRARDGSCWL